MPRREAQIMEYKSSWQEGYFEWISGYANADGGALYVGVNDDGYVVGVEDIQYFLDKLPNQVASYLGITVCVDHGTVDSLGYNIKYKKVPRDIAMKPENLYVRGLLTEQVLDDIEADSSNTKAATPAVRQLFKAAPGLVKQLRKSIACRKKVRDKLHTWVTENPVYKTSDGTLEYVIIKVNAYSHGVPYHGRYYTRSGGTTQELKGAELSRFLYDKVGLKWDAVSVSDVKLSHEALDFLRTHALEKNRLTQKAVSVSDDTLVKNLQILTKDGEYTRAAAMLFGDPEDVVLGAYIRIGYFVGGRLKYQDEIHGPLISQAHRAADLIFSKYLKGLVDIKGLQRTETYMTTEEILREVILNAVAHKHYPSNLPIQIKVSDDRISVMNEGYWPFENLAIEDVYNEHSSYPANPLIGDGLFFAGAMDIWGQGFMLIKDECRKTEAPLPEVKATDKYVTVTIRPCRKYMELLNVDSAANLGTSFVTSEGVSEGAGEGADKLLRVIAFCEEPKTRSEIQDMLGINSDRYIRQEVIQILLEDGRIARTIPDKPSSPKQKYVSTKTDMERARAIMDNNPVLAMSPGDIKRAGLTIDEYLEKFSLREQDFYKYYYEDEL